MSRRWQWVRRLTQRRRGPPALGYIPVLAWIAGVVALMLGLPGRAVGKAVGSAFLGAASLDFASVAVRVFQELLGGSRAPEIERASTLRRAVSWIAGLVFAALSIEFAFVLARMLWD